MNSGSCGCFVVMATARIPRVWMQTEAELSSPVKHWEQPTGTLYSPSFHPEQFCLLVETIWSGDWKESTSAVSLFDFSHIKLRARTHMLHEPNKAKVR